MNLERRGFTLIELLLVVVIVTATAALTIPVGAAYMARSDLSNATNNVVQNFRQAQQNAFNANQNDNWGVYVESGQVTLFKGSDYAGRDASFDQTTPLPGAISVSGSQEVLFLRGSGRVSAATTTTLSDQSGTNQDIEVSQIGVVSR